MHTRQSPLCGATAGMRSRCLPAEKKKNHRKRLVNKSEEIRLPYRKIGDSFFGEIENFKNQFSTLGK